MMKNVRKHLFSGLLVLMLLFGMFCVPVNAADETDITEDTIATNAKKGVARVVTITADGGLSTGSAFGIGTVGEETDTFITNRHVVTTQESSGFYTEAQHVYLMPDNYSFSITTLYLYDRDTGSLLGTETEDTDLDTDKLIECELVYYSNETDFAVIKASEPTGRVALQLASRAKEAHEGDPIYTIGYPDYSDEGTATSEIVDADNDYVMTRKKITYYGSIDKDTVFSGGISMFTQNPSENNTDIIQFDAAISHGNSGGPLVDASNGHVLGINTWASTDTETVNKAVDIHYVVDYLNQAGIPYNITSTHETDNEVSTDEVSTNEVSNNEASSSFPWVPIIIALAVVVIAVIAVFVVMYMRKQSGTAKAAYRPNHAQTSTSANTSGHQFNAAAQGGNKQVRYCPYCGSPLNGDAKFCGNCGKKLS